MLADGLNFSPPLQLLIARPVASSVPIHQKSIDWNNEEMAQAYVPQTVWNNRNADGSLACE